MTRRKPWSWLVSHDSLRPSALLLGSYLFIVPFRRTRSRESACFIPLPAYYILHRFLGTQWLQQLRGIILVNAHSKVWNRFFFLSLKSLNVDIYNILSRAKPACVFFRWLYYIPMNQINTFGYESTSQSRNLIPISLFMTWRQFLRLTASYQVNPLMKEKFDSHWTWRDRKEFDLFESAADMTREAREQWPC